MDPQTLTLFVATGIAAVFTFVWMAALGWGGVRYVRIEGGEPARKSALVIWAVSIAGAFTGPCCVLFGLVGLIGGLWILKGKSEPNPRTRAAALGAATGGGILVIMVVLMVLVMAIGGVFSR